MTSEMKVRIFKSAHNFSAAHFLVEMGKCERLHGHNYFVTVELGGSSGGDDTLVDFHKINPVIERICEFFDHKILIGEKDERSVIAIVDGHVDIRFKEKRFLFPESDCLLLPLAATTVERLAEYIANMIIEDLVAGLDNIKWIEVGVGEGSGQMALYRRPVR